MVKKTERWSDIDVYDDDYFCFLGVIGELMVIRYDMLHILSSEMCLDSVVCMLSLLPTLVSSGRI